MHPNYIEIEINTYCNRTCTWCPNSTNKRGNTYKEISTKVWSKFLDDLSKNNYRGWLAFHNYNEPLYDRTLITKLNEIHSILPNVKLSIYTNGDNLSNDFLEQFNNNGVKELFITLYPKAIEGYGMPRSLYCLKFLDDNIQVNEDISFEKVSRSLRGETLLYKYKNVNLNLFTPNTNLFSSRLNKTKIKNYKSRTECDIPFKNATIDIEGNLKLCCQIYDSDKNKDFIIGNILDEDFFVLWNSPKMEYYRNNIRSKGLPSERLCSICDLYN